MAGVCKQLRQCPASARTLATRRAYNMLLGGRV